MSNNTSVKKDKFYSRPIDSMMLACNNMKQNIESENELHKFKMTKKDKMIDRPENERLQQINYGFNYGAGRGFGNLDMANNIRFGDNSRADIKQYKEDRESQQTFDHMFSYLDNNKHTEYQNSINYMVRGGENTRKQNQLNIDTMRNVEDFSVKKNIEFKY